MINDVIKAFRNQPENTVPFSVWHHFTPNEHIEATSQNKMLKADIIGEQHYIRTFHPDFIKLMDDGFFTYQFNNVNEPRNLKSLARIQSLPKHAKWLTNQFRLIKGQLQNVNSHKLTFGSVFSPVTLLKWKLVVDKPASELYQGDRIFTDLYLKDPNIIIKALKVISKDVKKQIKVERIAGVSGIYYSTQEIQDPRLGKTFFNRVQKPLDMSLIKDMNLQFKTGILHICGFSGAHNHLPWFVSYQLPVVNWSTDTDGYSLDEGKRLFNNKVVLGGLGITKRDVLYRGNKSEIQQAVNQLLDESGTKGVILGADCTIQRDTPKEHIKWAEEAAHNYLIRKDY